ncbi:MAG TPA: hypothetical protein VGF01_11310 [Terracidiphilus sp.]
MSDEKVVNVSDLWTHLRGMEEEKRFNGQAYPAGMSCFPFRLTGQGFFPGGDGLWREEDHIFKSSSGLVATRGIMFLGNDFGTCKSYERLRKKGFENPLTWKHVKRRIARAELPSSLTFFTNAVMGLRDGGTALEKKDWDAVPLFKNFCREFLIFQIETLQPKLIVVMGTVPKATLDSLAIGTAVASERFPKLKIGNNMTTVYYSTHPYGDFNFDDVRKVRDGLELRDAWTQAQMN